MSKRNSKGKESATALLIDANEAFTHLLNDDLSTAKSLLTDVPNSPFHTCALGLLSFIEASIGAEDKDLSTAVDLLFKAEESARKWKGKEEGEYWWSKGTTWEVLQGDAVVCQGCTHIMTESYVEFMKAIYKLNRAYKIFQYSFKSVFPAGVAGDASVPDIINTLNKLYSDNESKQREKRERTANSPSYYSLLTSWSRKPMDMNGSGASAPIPKLHNKVSHKKEKEDEDDGISLSATSRSLPSSAPVTPMLIQGEQGDELLLNAGQAVVNLKLEEEEETDTPKPLWENDPWASFTIGGACFGFGLFGLVFSMLPPKLRKLTSWFGFTNMSRPSSLKLLSVAAQCSNDIHACISALILCFYYQSVILVCGWQSNGGERIKEMKSILDNMERFYPNSTLWILMRSKLARAKKDVEQAISILELSKSNPSSFRQAKSLLIFELGWNYLSNWDFSNASMAFSDVKTFNSWSHPTYNFMSAGCLLSLPEDEKNSEVTKKRIQELLAELPSMIGKKRMLGEQLPSETFIQRKIGYYQYKFSRWCAGGRLNKEKNQWWDTVMIPPQWEFSVFWNAIPCMPDLTLRRLIAILSTLSPEATPGYSKHGPVKFKPTDDLDTTEELVVRSLLLGLAFLGLAQYEIASAHLADAAVRGIETDDVYTSAYANYGLALCVLCAAERKSDQSLSTWEQTFTKAEVYLEEIFKRTEHYNFKSRLESRVSMLRSEMSVKRDSMVRKVKP